jgi:hypothetical protein
MSLKEKLLIVFTAPALLVHIYWATKKFEKGGKEKRDEHYRWLQYGIGFYIALLFGFTLMVRYKVF